MTAPKVTPYAPIDPDLGVEELRLLARRYQVERDVARAGERAASAMAADVAARMNGALSAYRAEVEAAMRAAFDGAAQVIMAPCPKRTGAEHMARDGGGVCIFCGADIAAMAARPVLTEGAARAMVERTWDETAGGVAEMHDAFTALLLRVAGPVTAEQASMAAAFDAAKGGAS